MSVPILLVMAYPPEELHPNKRPGRWDKIIATRQYRYDCRTDAMKQMRERYPLVNLPLQTPVKATVEFITTTKRNRDADNLMASCKALWDGLRDAGVLASDTAETFLPVFGGITVGTKAGLRVLLETVSIDGLAEARG